MSGGYGVGSIQGASKNTLFEALHKSLNEAMGTAYSQADQSLISIENYALAKTMVAFYYSAQRMKNQFDPTKTTDFLDRWMAICGLAKYPNENDFIRRHRLATHFKIFTKPPTPQNVADYLIALIGADVFQEVVTHTSGTSLGSLPGGLSIIGGVTLPDGDWRTHINSITIVLEQPVSVTDSDFKSRYSQVFDRMDMYLPAYVKFFIGRELHDPTTGLTNKNNSNGTNVRGFYLDNKMNLDNAMLT